jgi:RHS repeat-associated protein
LSSGSGPSEFLAPGQAAFLNTATPAELQAPDAALRILYYHHDHLSSSSVLTDANGALVEETAFYPFGAERTGYRPRQFEESYKFTQKERDAESGLSYFGARFLASRLARFTRVDPLAADPPSSWLESPQRLNPYSYVVNNPLKFVDPAGKDRQKAGPPATKPRVLIMYGDSQYKDFAQHAKKWDRGYFEQALKSSYQKEGGADADYVVVEISSKTKDDMEKLFKGSSFDTVVYDGHGSGKTKVLLPEGKLGSITPTELADWSSQAKSKPKKFFFYGCNTAKSGFARVLSEKLPGTEVTGSGARIAPYYTYGKHPSITEDRDHNITFQDGKETLDVRKVDINNATLPR